MQKVKTFTKDDLLIDYFDNWIDLCKRGSVPSISKRLGHASIATTQKVYLHLISELENQDNDQIMRYLSSLN